MNKKDVINAIENYITHRFNNMTYDEYEDMCYGTGTLSVLDDALSQHDSACTLDDNDVTMLTKYCCDKSDEFGKRFAMYQLSQELEDVIASAFNNNDGLGRLQFWVDKFGQCAEHRDIEHLKNYIQLTTSIAMSRGLNADELVALGQNYIEQLHQRADSIMDGFAKMCADQNVDYDDQDEWIQWLQNFECFNYQELQYINMLWTEEMKAKYKVQKD